MVTACAHELWENEGRPNGRALLHWARAQDIFAPAMATSSRFDAKRMVYWERAGFSTYVGPMLGGTYRLTVQLAAVSDLMT